MAIGHDASSKSTISTSAASFSWTHAGTANAKGIIVFVLSVASTAKDTSVTYNSVSMNLIGSGVDTDTEPGFVRCYYLDAPSTGSQTVLVNRTNDATQVQGFAATVTAASATEVYTAGMITQGGSSQNTGANTSGTGTAASGEASVDDGSPGTNSLRYAAYYTGAATPIAAGANSTSLQTEDYTAFGWTFVRETTAGQGSRSVGVTTGTTDDRASVHIAVRETPASSAGMIDPMGTVGIFGL